MVVSSNSEAAGTGREESEAQSVLAIMPAFFPRISRIPLERTLVDKTEVRGHRKASSARTGDLGDRPKP